MLARHFFCAVLFCFTAAVVSACPYLRSRNGTLSDEDIVATIDAHRALQFQQTFTPSPSPSPGSFDNDVSASFSPSPTPVDTPSPSPRRIQNKISASFSPSPTPVDSASGDQIATALANARADIAGILDGDLIAKFLRLVFHDCVGGICDGCVDLSLPENFGLGYPMRTLGPIVDRYSDVLTRGDIYVLAAMVSIESSQTQKPIVPFEMEWVGRPECNGRANRGPSRPHPSSHMVTQELLDFFDEEFGFTSRDTTAIMGVHTL